MRRIKNVTYLWPKPWTTNKEEYGFPFHLSLLKGKAKLHTKKMSRFCRTSRLRTFVSSWLEERCRGNMGLTRAAFLQQWELPNSVEKANLHFRFLFPSWSWLAVCLCCFSCFYLSKVENVHDATGYRYTNWHPTGEKQDAKKFETCFQAVCWKLQATHLFPSCSGILIHFRLAFLPVLYLFSNRVISRWLVTLRSFSAGVWGG